MCVNHLETTPPHLVYEKTVFHKTRPWYEKDWRLQL